MRACLVGILCFGRAASLSLQSPCCRQPSYNTQHKARRSAYQMMEEPSGPSLRQLVQKDRLIRKAGVGAGAVFVAAAAGLGSSAGIISGDDLLRVALCGGTLAAGLAAGKFLSNQESQPPRPASHFEVAPSPGKGSGLFATCAIEPGTYLFDYEGEILDEDAFFARYPNADGRYIAGITDDYYIDGVNPELSNQARWMNHAKAANVVWKKQTLGPKPAMHFYACARVLPGDELCFDYGDEYWDALGVTPL